MFDVDLHLIAYITIYASACFNPIIYVIMNKQYRKAYKSVLKFKWCETATKRVPVLRSLSKRLHPNGNPNAKIKCLTARSVFYLNLVIRQRPIIGTS